MHFTQIEQTTADLVLASVESSIRQHNAQVAARFANRAAPKTTTNVTIEVNEKFMVSVKVINKNLRADDCFFGTASEVCRQMEQFLPEDYKVVVKKRFIFDRLV